MDPLFLFSLPRSGSTLIQRILATDENISTVSEPWILLPYIDTLKKDRTYSDYGHKVMVEAIEDFCALLPNGQEDYLMEIRELVLRLYAKNAHSTARYFLDKTPRYSLIVEDIIRLFPDAKFIFLWRNPLAVVISMMDTWAKGKWNLYRYKIDLFQGLANLILAYEHYNDKVYSLNYETFISSPETELSGLFNYLELPFNSEILLNYNKTQLRGRYGDSKGMNLYQCLSQQSLDKWKQSSVNPIRKLWCRQYLKWIGSERLAVMGYELTELIDELTTIPFTLNMLNSDLLRISYGIVNNFVEFKILKHKLQTISDKNKICIHT